MGIKMPKMQDQSAFEVSSGYNPTLKIATDIMMFMKQGRYDRDTQ